MYVSHIRIWLLHYYSVDARAYGRKKIKSATRVQFLGETVSISLHTNTLGKSMNPSLFSLLTTAIDN